MAFPGKSAFEFSSQALSKDTFYVVSFQGEEGLSMPYRFEILLVSQEREVDDKAVINAPAVFTLKRPSGDLPFHGILQSFEQMQQVEQQYAVYRAVLAPKLWWLQLTHHNQVFLDKNCPQILEAVLQDGGLQKGKDFELRLRESYPVWEYACQYDESHFAFASRWMERYGLYYFFEQADAGEKMIITDSAMAHQSLPGGEKLRYAPKSGLEAPYADEVATSFHVSQRLMPRTVLLRDYYYLQPHLELAARAEVDPQGQGETYIYGEHFRTSEEGKLLAKVRAQEIACGKKTCEIASSSPLLRSGYTFTLQHHFLEQANDTYLAVSLKHKGSQAEYLVKGVDTREDESGLFYRNTCVAIPASVQFRPQRPTPKPRFHGVMNAHVDAAGSGQYAELDEHGRYKVVLPFDLSGREGGHASSWLRMMQPYAGSDHGMHFPLHKGAEVLLCCIDGDPDRPFIAAAVPNPEHKSLVDEKTQTQCRLTTSGQNKMHVEDRQGSERILMHTPTAETFLRIGEPNDPPSSNWEKEEDKVGFKLQTNEAFEVYAGSENEVIMIENSLWVGELREKLVEVLATEINIGDFLQWKDPFDTGWSPLMNYLHGKVQTAVGAHEELSETNLEIAEQLLKMREMKEKLTEEKQSLATAKQKIVQDHTDLGESVETLEEEKTQLTQESESLAQLNTTLSEEKVALEEEVTQLAEARTSLAQSVTSLRSEKTSMTESVTTLAQNKMDLGSMKSQVSEDYMAIFAMTMKV